METKLKLPGDHSGIVKFPNREDLGYRTAVKFLKEFDLDAEEVVATRFCRSTLLHKAHVEVER